MNSKYHKNKLPNTSEATSACAVAIILGLGVLTGFAIGLGPELSLFTTPRSIVVSDFLEFDSFSEPDITRQLREAECKRFHIRFADAFAQFRDREKRYFDRYQLWLQRHAHGDTIEAFQTYQKRAGQPPAFNGEKWVPLIEAKLQEFEGTEGARGLRAVLRFAKKRQNP